MPGMALGASKGIRPASSLPILPHRYQLHFIDEEIETQHIDLSRLQDLTPYKSLKHTPKESKIFANLKT